MKISKVVISIVTVVIVAILGLGLILGLGIIRGKSVTTTEIMTQTFYETQTQMRPVTETLVSTDTRIPTTVTLSTTEISLSLSHSTVTIPSTVNLTQVESKTVYATTTQNETVTASGVVIVLPAGSLISFASSQRFDLVPQGSITVGFNGFFEISYQTSSPTPVYWVLEGNSVNEMSSSGPSGGVEFPVQAGVPYSLLIYNGDCPYAGCYSNAFNVTATIVYQY